MAILPVAEIEQNLEKVLKIEDDMAEASTMCLSSATMSVSSFLSSRGELNLTTSITACLAAVACNKYLEESAKLPGEVKALADSAGMRGITLDNSRGKFSVAIATALSKLPDENKRPMVAKIKKQIEKRDQKASQVAVAALFTSALPGAEKATGIFGIFQSLFPPFGCGMATGRAISSWQLNQIFKTEPEEN